MIADLFDLVTISLFVHRHKHKSFCVRVHSLCQTLEFLFFKAWKAVNDQNTKLGSGPFTDTSV